MKTAAPLVPCVLLLLLLLVLTAGTAAADIVVPERPWRPAPPPGPHEVVVRVAAHLGPFAACDFGDRYVVRPGDTLTKIARDMLGEAKRWREIATLNPAFKPTVMPVGVHLLLPAVHPPAENYYAFFIVPSDHAAHALVQGHVLSHRSPDTTWRIAAVPLAGWEAFMAATRESDTFAARLEALHAAGHVALSAPHGGKTMLPAHDRASEVVLDVTVTAIEGGEVHAEATRRGPHPAWPVAADTLRVETPSGGPPAGGVPALEEARAPEPPAEAATIGTVTIALLTALLLAIAVAAFFALRHTDPRRAE